MMSHASDPKGFLSNLIFQNENNKIEKQAAHVVNNVLYFNRIH